MIENCERYDIMNVLMKKQRMEIKMDNSMHEKIARELKERGNNCSNALYSAFAGDLHLSGDIPAPRSIGGRCGALLTSIRILQETGHEEEIEAFEEEFRERFEYVTCIDLMTHERRCNDYVGESARMLDEIILTSQEERG